MLAFLSRVMSCGPEGQKALADPDDDVRAITVKMDGAPPSVAPPVKAVIVPPTPSQEVAAPKSAPKPPTSARPTPHAAAKPKPAATPAPLPPVTTKMFVWHTQWKPQAPFVSYGDYTAATTVAAAMASRLVEAACAPGPPPPRSEYMAYWAPATFANSALPQAEFNASLSLPEGKRCMLERAAREVQKQEAKIAAAKKKQAEMDKRFKKSPGRSPMKSSGKPSPFGKPSPMGSPSPKKASSKDSPFA